jgi:carboxypeptidase T
VRRFVQGHDIKICLTYHTYGELVLYPWGHTQLPALQKAQLEEIGEGIASINKYTLSQSVGLYPTVGDATDWMYGRHRIIPYTIELGTSYAPEDPEILRQMSISHVGVNLFVCEEAELL